MRYLLLLLLSLNLFAVDASLKIETDVEHRTRIAVVDGSAVSNSTFFNTLLADLKISGHFLSDTTHHKGDFNSAVLSPSLKNREYVLKYNLAQSTVEASYLYVCSKHLTVLKFSKKVMRFLLNQKYHFWHIKPFQISMMY